MIDFVAGERDKLCSEVFMGRFEKLLSIYNKQTQHAEAAHRLLPDLTQRCRLFATWPSVLCREVIFGEALN